MSVFFVFIVALGTVTALGSGPYLPSGWRPKGPAFLLPTEEQEPSPRPRNLLLEASSTSAPSGNLQEAVSETEASGSDFLREYGPPDAKDVYKAITVQALPDLETERPFAIIETRTTQNTSVIEDSETLKTNNGETTTVEDETNHEDISKTDILDDAKDEISNSVTAEVSNDISSTEAALPVTDDVASEKVEEVVSEDATTTQSTGITTEEAIDSVINIEESEVTERGSLEYLPAAENELSNDALFKVKSNLVDNKESSLEYLPPVSKPEVETEDAIPLYKAKLETESEINTGLEYRVPVEIKETESSSKVIEESVDEVKSSFANVENKETELKVSEEKVDESSGLEHIPKVEEQAGFREYGPPRPDAGEKSEDEKIENNETRRRRFSSKFSPVRKH